MASYFGEVVEPSTRAIFEDDGSDEDEALQEPKRIRKLDWNDDVKIPEIIDFFVLIEGKLATDFMKKCIFKADHHKQVGEVKEISSNKSTPGYFRPAKSAYIYQLPSNGYACLCSGIDINDANEVRNALHPLLQVSKKVILMTSTLAQSFKCNNPTLELPPSFMRSLHSSLYGAQDVIAPPLEQPNFVSGVPAAVLTWCEVEGVPGCLYICYSDSEEVDSISARPLTEITSSLPKSLLLNTEKLNFKQCAHDPSSNLYI